MSMSEIESATDLLVDAEINALGVVHEKVTPVLPPVILRVCEQCAGDKFPVSRLETQLRF